MTPTIHFVLYLITLPDIESDKHAIHRLYFDNLEQCHYYANALGQHYDPIGRKANCGKVDNYIIEVRAPLPKPDFMD